MDLTFVSPDELRQVWHIVEPQIEAVCARTHARWLPEDVYASIAMGHSHIWLWRDMEGSIVGHIVLTKTKTWGEVTCDVWCCYHNSQDRTSTVVDVWPWVKEQARAMGADVIQIEGPRAYHRVIPELTAGCYTFTARV